MAESSGVKAEPRLKGAAVKPKMNSAEVLRKPRKHPVRNSLARAALAAAATVGGLQIGHEFNPEIPNVQGIYRSVENAISSIPNIIPKESPSKGDVFNPRATSGEITELNTITISTEEALNLLQQKTQDTKESYFLLPKKSNATLEYEVKDGVTGIRGDIEGAMLVSPYNGFLKWEKYESNGAMEISIYESANKPGEIIKILPLVTFTVSKDANLPFPPELFNTVKKGPEGLATISSSEIAVNAGQHILSFTGNSIVPGTYEENHYQLAVHFARILSENNKAVLTSD